MQSLARVTSIPSGIRMHACCRFYGEGGSAGRRARPLLIATVRVEFPVSLRGKCTGTAAAPV